MTESAPVQDITIVGGGLAAVRTAQALRNCGYDGSIRMYSDESEPPYDRPPLSKDFLSGELETESLRLLNTGLQAELGVDLHLDSRAVALDLGRHQVGFTDGSQVSYDRLIVATGAQARILPGFETSDRIHYLRNVADAQALRSALAAASRITVVGTGFIGLEVASTARQLGLEVDIVAADEGPMIGIVGRQLSAWLTDLHASKGVRITSSVLVTSVDQSADAVTVTLSDGSQRSSEVVAVGAGISRDLKWLIDAGLEVDRGLVCDLDGRTSDPYVFGVGDVVCVHHVGGDHEDIQHWTAAADSARRTAHVLAGRSLAGDGGDGFFWTEQHGHRMQFVGAADIDASVDVQTGSLEEGRFVAYLRSGDLITGVFASSSPREFLKHRIAFQQLTKAQKATAGVHR
jgi:3-phenylpropionate/trans-cinnamate dioxygenase ferredoxin reductase subunit